MDIGFIGLGSMGHAMVANLIKAGHTVRVWNRSPGPAEQAATLGATVVATPAEAFAGDAVLSMLADDKAVRQVILGDALPAATPGLVHVNLSTISVALATELAEAHAQHGVDYVAAPVLGRPDVAAAGKLNIIAGGAPAVVARVQPLFDAIGQRTWPVGEAPRANAIKLAVNFMLGAAIEATAEATALAAAHGFAAGDFIELISSTVFPGPVYQGYGTRIANNDYEPAGFKAQLALKDLNLAISAAGDVHAPMPLASVVRDHLLEAVAEGSGDSDFAVLGKLARRRAGQP